MVQVATWVQEKIKDFAKDLLILPADASPLPSLRSTQGAALKSTVAIAWQFLRGQTGLQTTCCIIIRNHVPEKACYRLSLFIKKKKTHKEQEEQKISIMSNKWHALNATEAGSRKELALCCTGMGNRTLSVTKWWPHCILKYCSAGSGRLRSGIEVRPLGAFCPGKGWVCFSFNESG